jgi:hypothetical protein
MLRIEGLKALSILHEFVVGPMHHLDIPLQVCSADWGVLDRVQSRRWWELRGLAGQTPEATRLTGRTRVVHNGRQGLPNSVKGPINVIMCSTPAPANSYGAVRLR